MNSFHSRDSTLFCEARYDTFESQSQILMNVYKKSFIAIPLGSARPGNVTFGSQSQLLMSAHKKGFRFIFRFRSRYVTSMKNAVSHSRLVDRQWG